MANKKRYKPMSSRRRFLPGGEVNPIFWDPWDYSGQKSYFNGVVFGSDSGSGGRVGFGKMAGASPAQRLLNAYWGVGAEHPNFSMESPLEASDNSRAIIRDQRLARQQIVSSRMERNRKPTRGIRVKSRLGSIAMASDMTIEEGIEQEIIKNNPIVADINGRVYGVRAGKYNSIEGLRSYSKRLLDTRKTLLGFAGDSDENWINFRSKYASLAGKDLDWAKAHINKQLSEVSEAERINRWEASGLINRPSKKVFESAGSHSTSSVYLPGYMDEDFNFIPSIGVTSEAIIPAVDSRRLRPGERFRPGELDDQRMFVSRAMRESYGTDPNVISRRISEATARKTSPGVMLRKKRLYARRLSMYSQISKKAFGTPTLRAMGFDYHKNNLYHTTQSLETYRYLDPLSGRLDSELSEYNYTKIRGGVKRRGPKALDTEFYSELLRREESGNLLVGADEKSSGLLVSTVDRKKFYKNLKEDPRSILKIRETSKSVKYMDAGAVTDFGKYLFDQNKYLQTSRGKIVHPGQRRITGYYQNVETSDRVNLSKNKLKKLRADVLRISNRMGLGSDWGEINLNPRLRDVVFDELGLNASELLKSGPNKDRVFKRINPVGVQAQRELLNSLASGTTVRFRGGGTAVVQDVTSPEHIGVPLEEGGFKSWKGIVDEEMDRQIKIAEEFNESMFRVNLRKYSWSESSLVGDPNAVEVLTAGGQQLGHISSKYNKEMFRDIASGMIPGEHYAKVYKTPYKEGGELKYVYNVGLFQGGKPRYSSEHWSDLEAEQKLAGSRSFKVSKYIQDTTPIRTNQGLLSAIYRKKWMPEAMTEAVTSNMMSKYPTVFRDPSLADVSMIGNDVPKSKGLGKYMLGAAIAASAVMIYAANKRDMPLTEKEIPESQYGYPDRSAQEPSASYRPKTRIVQNNSGYSTKINVEMRDKSGRSEYNSLVSTMSEISSRALGVKTRSSLNVTDESTTVDRESVRRSMNLQLR